MEVTEIGQRINELTLNGENSQAILQEVVKKLTQSLQGDIGFLITIANRNSASWSNSEVTDKKRLRTLEAKLKFILTESCYGDENKIRDHILSLLKNNLTYSAWEVCVVSDECLWGWFILGSDQGIGLNHHLVAPLQQPLCLALKTAQLQSEVEKKQRYQELQHNVTEEIHNSQEIETVLESAIAQLTQGLEITRGIALTLRYAEPIFSDRRTIAAPDIEVQPLTQWTQSPDWEVPLTTFSLTDSSLCLKAWQQAPTPVSVQGMQTAGEPPFLNTPHPLPALLIAPLMGTSSGSPNSQMVLGLLLLQHEHARIWQPEEKEIVSWVCTEASTAIVYKKTIQRVQSLVNERTAQLKHSLDVQARLYETTKHQVKQLQELNQLKDDILTAISHELYTPLATMKMAIQMLHHPQISPERRVKYLNILEQEWHREFNLIKDLLTLQSLEKEEIVLQAAPINLHKLLRQLKEEFQQKWRKKGLQVTLNLEPLEKQGIAPFLYSDGESLRRIFSELLTNASKYSTANTTVEITLSQPVSNWIQISITNVGCGIPPEDLKHIFERFWRGRAAIENATPGTGLGLPLLKALVQHLHGTIEVDSQYDREQFGKTTFSVTFPRSFNEVSSLEPS